MSEQLLQFIWLHRLYATKTTLQTTEGEAVIVLHPGRLNTNAGPDFLEAKLKIGNTLWAGHIELHLCSSDWTKHQHQHNPSYTKLIAHVVYDDDMPVTTADESAFPTIALKDHIDLSLLNRYDQLMQNQTTIPCADSIRQVPDIILQQQLSRMMAERLEQKMTHIRELLLVYRNNWQEVFYTQLARAFGLHINQDAFEKLALQTPLNVLIKHRHNLMQLEAILFGQAGFLADYFSESYPVWLQREYNYLQRLYQLTPLQKQQWKFMRLRPANFPTIRLAQFAQLIADSSHLFSKIMEAETLREFEQLLQVSVTGYWLNHYHFDDVSAESNKATGKQFIRSILINVIVPLMYIYGKEQGKESTCEKAIDLLHQLPAEKNAVLLGWQQLGIHTNSAADTQALLQLKANFCDSKRCLACSIGHSILSDT